jgi:hypothetical protein
METYISDAKKIQTDLKLKLKETAFKDLDSEDRLKYYQKKYNEFAMHFPLVLRYMVQLGQYNQKAFKRFIAKLQTCPYRTELEYCERQADYIKYLYMELNTHYDNKRAAAVWKNAFTMLKNELEIFKNAEESVKKNLEKNNEMNNIEKRKELKKLLLQLK